jgi:hypothetical protein
MVDATVLVREYLLSQPEVTALLGTNANGSIYCAYDLPEHFDPKLGPCIQIFRAGGHSHVEITALIDARLCIRAWADQEQYSTASALYGAINDVLHGATKVVVADGAIVRAIEADGPLEMTDPDTAWVAMYAFYQVLARPNSGAGPAPYTPVFYQSAGPPTVLENDDDVYYDENSGNLYEQAGAWVYIGNIPPGGSTMPPSLIYHKVAAATLNAANIKAAAGTVTGWKIYNYTEYPVFVKLFDKAGVPVPGTDTPKQTIGVDAGVGEVCPPNPGLSYATGIGIAITKNILDNDMTAVAAGDCVVDIFYQ